MSQTTMKIDRDVLADLRTLAKAEHRSPQKHLRLLVEREKTAKALKLDFAYLTPEQKARFEMVRETEASEALEGYAPLSESGDYAYELQKKWVLGQISTEERINLLKKSVGL